jgi:hypothetical protein
MSSTKDFAFSIDLTVRNEWKNIDLLRTSVQNCFTAVFADLDGCHAIAMVTGELLENALKYGNWTQTDRTMFRLRVTGQSENVEIAVQNPLDPDDSNAQALEKSISWINSYPKPEHAYRARLLQIAQEDTDGSPSRLGLVRIAHEGNCRLSMAIDNGVVTVMATLHLDGAG